MKPIFLIATNFLREQRWPVIALLLFVGFFGVMLGLTGGTAGDLTFIAMYGLAFTGLLAASAINNERRSRRILLVLSKGIERGEYLAGLLSGVMLAVAAYCIVIGAVAGVALARNGVTAVAAGELVILLLALFVLVSTTAMFFSTFLHPFFATAAAALLLAVTGALGEALGGGTWRAVLPAYTLVAATTNFGSQHWRVPWMACLCALLEALILWGLATAVFSRRDIAVAVE